ncbi:hypothetical protein BWZ20_03785 [Winogradskyella sp. J14-2]|uniref:hypothetical protein n=1 Tax=Winogradskyella sp. J14-2 TaxID=1936080 RepID=UPI000972A522|nr:hypothetical protein [Winogradskyella sp. J14-2]APY07474.1 hypothetical protein BWZ20_03785 [Winogradskyella sp. J14-2]
MKNYFLLFVIIAPLCLQSCIGWGNQDDDIPNDFPADLPYEPIIMERSEFENSTTLVDTAHPIENSGKIYVKGNFIYVNEVNQGFHIIDNSDPANPINIGFIKVLGSSDLSLKNDIFYVNNARDLIAFKIDEVSRNLIITKRLENVFPQIWSPLGPIYYPVEENEIVVDWQLIN